MVTTTLQLWSVIGTWVAGLGTVSAVIISLWLALHHNKIKLKVTAGHRLVITPGEEDAPEFCSIHVVNVGVKPAKIISVSWRVGRGKNKRHMIQSFNIQPYETVPKLLTEGEDVSFMVPFNYDGSDRDWIVRFPKYLVDNGAPNIIKTLKVGVHTSVGDSFYSAVENNLTEKLLEAYEQFKDVEIND